MLRGKARRLALFRVRLGGVMLDLNAIRERARSLWAIRGDANRKEITDACVDIHNLIGETEVLRLKVQIHDTQARLNARRVAQCQ
jgi:hypothetical protein